MKKLILMLMLISLISVSVSKNANARNFNKGKLEEIAQTMGKQAGYKVIFAGKIPNRAKEWFCNDLNGGYTGFCNIKYYLDSHTNYNNEGYSHITYIFSKLSWKHALERFLTRYDFTINFVGNKIISFYNPEHIFTKWNNPDYTVKIAGSKLKKSDIINAFSPFILHNDLTMKKGIKAFTASSWQWMLRQYKYSRDLGTFVSPVAYFLSVPKSALKGE